MAKQQPGPLIVFDFGGTNFRAGILDPETGKTAFLVNVEGPEPAPEGAPGRTPQDRIEAAFDELFGTLATKLDQMGIEPQGVAVSSRGAFSTVGDERWWVLRSHPTMEFSPRTVEMATKVVRARHLARGDEPTEREVAAEALMTPAFPLQRVLERMTKKHLGLAQKVVPLQDAAANLMAEAKYAGLDPRKRPALVTVGTGVGYAVLGADGLPKLDKNGHGPGISRLVVDEETGLTLTAATNGSALVKRFGRKATEGDQEMIEHAARYLGPVVAKQMAADGADHLFLTGGVVEGLGQGLANALQIELRKYGVTADVQLGRLGDAVGLVGAGAYGASQDLGAKKVLTLPAVVGIPTAEM